MVLVIVAAVLLGRFRLNDNLFSAVLTMVIDADETTRFTWTFIADSVLGAGLAIAAVLPDQPVRRHHRGVGRPAPGRVRDGAADRPGAAAEPVADRRRCPDSSLHG
jgi:hypothetical protein